MSKTIIVVGFGPANATAVAERFGAAGFQVAVVGRNRDRLDAGVAALQAKGITAAAFLADAGNPEAVRKAISDVRAHFGPITVVHWNAFGGLEVGDLATAAPATVHGIFDVAVIGLLAAVQEALPDMRGTKEGAILITNGAFGEVNPDVDAYAVASNNMGIALANAAKNKLVGLLAQRLKPDDVYVAEVMIAGSVKGTAGAGENAIEPSRVASQFWELYQGRTETRARIS